MTLPKNRSHSMRKISRRTPQGTSVTYSRRKKGGKHYCALCKMRLQAVTSKPALCKSERAPNRAFGGRLCSACQRHVVRQAARMQHGVKTNDTLELRLRPYVLPLVKKQ